MVFKIAELFFVGWMWKCVYVSCRQRSKKQRLLPQYNRKGRKNYGKRTNQAHIFVHQYFYSKFFTISKSFTPFIWCVVKRKKRNNNKCTQHTVTICSCRSFTITSLSHEIALKYSTTTNDDGDIELNRLQEEKKCRIE